MPEINRLGCIGISTGSERCSPQSPASSRLRLIRAANETANRTAAWVNVGVAGAKTGVAPSVGGMMNTFDKFGEFWKMGGSGDQILSPGPRYVSDFCADVCSRQATRPALMRLTQWPSKAALPGGGMAYIQGVCHSLGSPAPRSRFQTAPRPGRFSLIHPETPCLGDWSPRLDGRASHTAPLRKGSCAQSSGTAQAACPWANPPAARRPRFRAGARRS